MKDFGDGGRAALRDGTAISVGAVEIDSAPDAVRVWGGFNDLTIDGEIYTGVGDRGLVSAVGSALGDSEQNVDLMLSGIDPTIFSLFDMGLLRNVPTIVRRLLFGADSKTLLAAPIFTRGRLDQATKQETASTSQGAGTATIQASVESAARGLGRGGGRMRALADQFLIDPTDDGMKSISYAGQVTLYWGGKPPQIAAQAFSAATPGGVGGGIGIDTSGLQFA